ncbi:hypothetical protein [Melittangium boletus]|uniref:Uncharacterized protein n=1 Tax=Melittangium boletus DSM 14713 TaxID=1294270 RepID=A0A250IER9_9BACT|nr:hypothetical protein [Melittangium boletus]ATB29733.1 hypothetical protein MEBOL_003188 [Melittangium boletus DSM 14713]
MSNEFRINYTNPRTSIPTPEKYEGYDLESAFYDYKPKGLTVTLEIDGYSLPMSSSRFIEFVLACLPLAEQLRDLPPETPHQLRKHFPEVPSDFKFYSWMFVDFMQWFPIIIFATDRSMTWIYTRTQDESKEHPLIVLPERDREKPVKVPRNLVIKEICVFLTRYLDDLSSAIPFIHSDTLYKKYRARIAALQMSRVLFS